MITLSMWYYLTLPYLTLPYLTLPYHTWTQIIYMDMQCPNTYLLEIFRILDDDEAQDLDLEDLDDEADDGYIYEVDLHYPTRLHNKHDDYPLAPESIVIDRSMYSPIQSTVFPESAPQKKLTPNLLDRKRYLVHYKHLKLYVKLGLVITKVHRVLAFK